MALRLVSVDGVRVGEGVESHPEGKSVPVPDALSFLGAASHILRRFELAVLVAAPEPVFLPTDREHFAELAARLTDPASCNLLGKAQAHLRRAEELGVVYAVRDDAGAACRFVFADDLNTPGDKPRGWLPVRLETVRPA